MECRSCTITNVVEAVVAHGLPMNEDPEVKVSGSLVADCESQVVVDKPINLTSPT